ncbi:MAG: hypothetical protein PHV18_14895 [Lachnospiraceae bacterium]|nr:hypothetical protein [Lachnospiraceae bacterium]
MYKISKEERESLLYIINHLTVTGPYQGGLLNNAAGILQSLKQEEDKKEEI